MGKPGESGRRFERQVCKKLGKWFCGDPKSFSRTPLSGGWSSRTAPGDIFPVTEEAKKFPFGVEVKNNQKFSWDRLVREGMKRRRLLEWWEGHDDEITKSNVQRSLGEDRQLYRILIFKEHHKSVYVMFGEREMDEFGLDDLGLCYITVNREEGENVHIFELDSVLDEVDPKDWT